MPGNLRVAPGTPTLDNAPDMNFKPKRSGWRDFPSVAIQEEQAWHCP